MGAVLRKAVAAWACMLGGAGPACAGADPAGQGAAGVVHSGHVPAGYVLDWHDEFDSPLDAGAWAHFLTDRPREWVRLSREAVSNEAGGVLVLTASDTARGPVSAWITTQPTYRRAGGYFEARIQPQAASGLRGAFWMLSASIGQPPGRPSIAGGEIDILSYDGDAEGDRALSQGVYWESYEDTPVVRTNASGQIRKLSNAPPQRVSATLVDLASAGVTNAPASAGYHIFSLLWTETEYVFHVDGRETFRTTQGVSQAPHFLCLSLLPPPGAGGRSRAANLPASMRVDYVRVYAAPAEAPAPPRPSTNAAPAGSPP